MADRFEPGVPVVLAPGVRRLVAPNPSAMTGPGTNTYLLGERELTVLDAGPDIADHVDAILRVADEAGAVITRLVCTHTHEDHSPAVAPLRERLGDVEIIGAAIADDGFQDKQFTPTLTPVHDQAIAIEGGALRAIHTPGHVGNHFCYLHEASGLVFTGDHIMQGSTVVIIPPAGDMKDYIASLELLLQYPVKALAPGHGELIDTPEREIRGLIAHRLRREAKVIDAGRKQPPSTIEDLTPNVYDDVDPKLHSVAYFSLWAHLIKLQKEGLIEERDGLWHFR